MKNVLVTGGAGFIGSALVRALVAEPGVERIVVVDNLSTGRAENLHGISGPVELVEADIREPAALESAFRGCDTIVQLAAIASVERSIHEAGLCHEVNLTGTLHVLEAARRCGARRLVFASSAAVYGSGGGLPKSESALPDPESPYAAQKLAGEHYLHVYHLIHGLETVALRFFNVYGPRQDPTSPYSGVLSIFCRAAMEDRTPTIFGDGEQTRDFIYVEDIARLVIGAARSPHAAGQVYNGGNGSRRSLNETWEILQNLAGTERPASYAEARKGDIRHSQADITRARADLEFDPAVAFDEGLRRTLRYLRTGTD